MDKYKFCENDPYLVNGTECLKNKLGIIDINKLEQLERKITDENIKNIQQQQHPYSIDTMMYIHETLFSSLYDWAGKIRSVGIWKGHTMFCVPERIEKEASKLFDKLNEDLSQKEEFLKVQFSANKLAFYYSELNVIHPFREGNGRTQRILFEFIAQDIGYSIHWLDNRDQWIKANISAYTTDHNELYELFLEILEPAI